MIYQKQCNNAEKGAVKTFLSLFHHRNFLLLSLVSRDQLTLTAFRYFSIQAIISLLHLDDVIVRHRQWRSEKFLKGGP